VPLDKARDPNLHPVQMASSHLSMFFGREITMRAGVVTPPDAEASSDLPICYIVHGFGGDHLAAWSDGAAALGAMRTDPSAPRMVYVYLDANCPFGHHEFADSPNNGPWCKALIEEFVPEIEGRFGGMRDPSRRFLTGHSSGGWSVLWLMIQRPDLFGGCWATAPDPVDFRDFSGVDIYTAANLYRDNAGQDRYLVLERGRPFKTFEQYTREELAERAHVQGIGGQMFSFDAVFSPRAWNGLPAPLYHRATGAIDPAVAQAWRRYDIGSLLRDNWHALAPQLAGKVHIWCGEWDTFALAGAIRLLRDDLAELEPDPAVRPDILLVPERDHFTLFQPHAELWPLGMMARIYADMARQAARAPEAAGIR
jgi:S-formylglutathione hydrolase FrmB